MQDQSLYSQMNNNPTFPEQEHLNCPRCDSPNTKFCYYNNYNLSQPRHFCKNCKRYWTKGGALRNIPIGGSSRKHSKRSSTPKTHQSSTTAATTTASAATITASAAPTVPKAALNEDQRIFNAILEPVKEGHSGNLTNGLSPDRPNLSLGSGSGSGSGSGLVRNDDQEEGHASKVEKNNLSTSSCGNSGSNWTDLSIFTPSSNY